MIVFISCDGKSEGLKLYKTTRIELGFSVAVKVNECRDSSGRRGNILIADDSKDDLFIFTHAYNSTGLSHSLFSVCDGEEVLAFLERRSPFKEKPRPDLLLLDLKMPRMNGFEVLAWLKTNPEWQNLPVVIVSSSFLPGDQKRAIELGAKDYKVKTGDIEELKKLILELESRWFGSVDEPAEPQAPSVIASS